MVLDDPNHADELSLGADGARSKADDRDTAAVLALVVDVIPLVSRLGNAAGVAGVRSDSGEAEYGCIGR